MRIPWLRAATGQDSAWWMSQVQNAVVAASRPSDDPDHDTTDVSQWLAEVVWLVMEAEPADRRSPWQRITDWLLRRKAQPYDENMRAAAILSVVAALWFSRLQYAKIYDPRRPLRLRRLAYERWRGWQIALMDAVFDESRDPVYFPDQEWDPPFAPEARSGSFV